MGKSRQGAAAPASLLERVHHVLYEQVGEAIQPIVHLETQWSPQELTKRIVRYIYNSAKNEELCRMPPEEAAQQLVEGAMGSYNASCGEKDWFFDLDLVPAFSAAAWELVRGQSRAIFSRVQAQVVESYEAQLDKLLLNKAMWKAVEHTFKDEAVRGKIFGAVAKTYYTAFDATISDSRPKQDLDRVQDFMSRWIHDSISRCWAAYENSPEVMSEANITRLFQAMLTPFGEEHPYTCVPLMLTERIGNPPRKWDFIGKDVRALLARWRGQVQSQENAPAAKRRKKKGGAQAEVFDAFAAADPELDFDGDAPEEEGDEELPHGMAAAGEEEELPAAEEEEAEAEGHPECTSAEDCIGSLDAKLVRHLLNGGRGDVYCSVCWESFLLSNPTLEGEYEE
eukprot:TRINITY_DN46067_c0_g1_i1.p1 TRINITY_DN46067_c0_g1~~TRINITY_DN46067_c0_g1_i1.p1  ORF type:complete len:396 (+),score=118.98 TRINITY_DN46067_c0_g1_i1:87-1274(+)